MMALKILLLACLHAMHDIHICNFAIPSIAQIFHGNKAATSAKGVSSQLYYIIVCLH